MECLRRGWDIPKRVAIAGFGNFDMARNSHPRITTIAVDCYEMGRIAAQRIIGLRAEHAEGEHRPAITIIPHRILARQTT